jgi:hypothetical protein
MAYQDSELLSSETLHIRYGFSHVFDISLQQIGGMMTAPEKLKEWHQICIDRGCDRTVGDMKSDLKDVVFSDRRKVSMQIFTWVIGLMWVIFAFITGGVVSYVYTTNQKQDEHITENRQEMIMAKQELASAIKDMSAKFYDLHTALLDKSKR